MVTHIRVNFILDDKMLQYVCILEIFQAYKFQQYVCVLSAILAANGQTWHEYALTAVNNPRWLIEGHLYSPYCQLLR